jgi:hypothetical protein
MDSRQTVDHHKAIDLHFEQGQLAGRRCWSASRAAAVEREGMAFLTPPLQRHVFLT